MFVDRLHHLYVAAAVLALSWTGSAWSQDSDAEDAVRATLRSYVEAFNSQDGAALGELWTESAVYVDRETGERIEGQAALLADFEELFDGSSDLRLVGEARSVQFVTDGVAIVEGVATVTGGDQPPAQSGFTATLARQEAGWRFHRVEESPIAQPPSAADALEPLAWLVGEWVDDADEGVQVRTSVSWSDGGSFLIRSYSLDLGDEAARQGTQLIGWDPRANEIRSWTFNADGSFGDGAWSQVGDAWHVKSSQTLANGDAASGTYVITPVDDDSITVQLIGHAIEGEPQPASAVVTVVRSSSRGSAEASEKSPAAARSTSKGDGQ